MERLGMWIARRGWSAAAVRDGKHPVETGESRHGVALPDMADVFGRQDIGAVRDGKRYVVGPPGDRAVDRADVIHAARFVAHPPRRGPGEWGLTAIRATIPARLPPRDGDVLGSRLGHLTVLFRPL